MSLRGLQRKNPLSRTRSGAGLSHVCDRTCAGLSRSAKRDSHFPSRFADDCDIRTARSCSVFSAERISSSAFLHLLLHGNLCSLVRRAVFIPRFAPAHPAGAVNLSLGQSAQLAACPQEYLFSAPVPAQNACLSSNCAFALKSMPVSCSVHQRISPQTVQSRRGLSIRTKSESYITTCNSFQNSVLYF